MTTQTPPELLQKPERKNFIINGSFNFWQRGTSHSNIGFGSADRWSQWYQNSTACTVSRQTFTLGQTDVPGNPRYYLRMDPSGGDGSGYGNIYQTIVGVERLAGQTITISFWAKASVANEKIQVGWTQKFGTGGTPSSRVDPEARPNIALTTSWKKYVLVFDIPSIEGKILGTSGTDALYIDIAHTVEASFGLPTGTFDIALVQVELGSIATEFEHLLPAEELELCQRYYETGWVHYIGYSSAASAQAGGFVTYNVKKFKAATVTLSSSENTNLQTSPGLSQRDSGFRVHDQTLAAGNFYYSATFTADADQG